tara:strand:- start:16 stop:1044 length:1029 start_codon:yes stop_codon:yes gene_type:complete
MINVKSEVVEECIEASPKIFIVGMARSGTVWTSQTLSTSSVVGVVGESLYWGRNYIDPDFGNGYSKEVAISAMQDLLRNGAVVPMKNIHGDADRNDFLQSVKNVVESSFFPENGRYTPKDVFDIGMGAFGRVMGKSVIVEKTPHHLMWLERINANYPESKFIITIRDPYECMLSYKHQSDRKTGVEKKKLKSIYHPVLYPIIWKASMNKAKKYSCMYDGRVLLIRNEDIKKDQLCVLKKIEKFLNLKEGDLKPREQLNSSFTEAVKPDLSSADIFWMNIMAGRLVKEYRGSLRLVGKDYSSIFFSTFTLFPSIFSALRVRAKDSNMNVLKYAASWIFNSISK